MIRFQVGFLGSWINRGLLRITAMLCPGRTEEGLSVLQRKITAGGQVAAEVSGMYSGLDLGTLVDEGCSAESTWVEMELSWQRNKEKLRAIVDQSGRAFVVLQGEFYGSGVPDPKLPEAFKCAYDPGWGHLGAFRTKLVVHSILSVRATQSTRRDRGNR